MVKKEQKANKAEQQTCKKTEVLVNEPINLARAQDVQEVCENVVEGAFDATMAIQSASIRAVEWQHQKDLQNLEEAIARKRNQLRAKIEMDHMKEKAKLEAKIQGLEHEILAQQHKFRNGKDQRDKLIEKFTSELNQDQVAHEKDLDRAAQTERNKTQDIMNKIAMVRTERERLVPEIGRLEGQMQIAYGSGAPGGNSEDNEFTRIPRGIADDLRNKLEETQAFYNKEEQRLESDAREQVDLLMDEVNNLDQELADERRHVEETQQSQAARLNELRLQNQKGNKGPIRFDEEKAKLIEEVSELKDQWRGLRGNEEEQLEATVQVTESKRTQGRERLLRQRADYFVERQNMAEMVNDIAAKIYEKQKQIDTAMQMFQDRARIKEKELSDLEDFHAAKMQERTERRDRRLQELENLEKEREKRRNLESTLLSTKEDKVRESFAVKKNHIMGAILEAEQRVKDVYDELNTPKEQDVQAIGEVQCQLADVKQQRAFLADTKNFAVSMAKKEIELMQDEGLSLKRSYADQMATKQRELESLKHADAKLAKELERQAQRGEDKFNKATQKLSNATNKMQEYIDNLSNEIARLERERQLLQEEYRAQQDGVRQGLVEDEQNLEKERARIHELIDKERGEFNQNMETMNKKIESARGQRDDMTLRFKRDVGQFTLKAMGSGPTHQSHAHILSSLQEKIQTYTAKIENMDSKLQLLMENHKADKDARLKEQRDKILNFQAVNDDLERKLHDKQKLVNEGNRMLKLYSNEDDCLYCRLSNQSKGRKEQLSSIYEENRRLTDKLTSLFKKEKEYERLSANEMTQLRSALEATSDAASADKVAILQTALQGRQDARKRTISMSSTSTVTTTD